MVYRTEKREVVLLTVPVNRFRNHLDIHPELEKLIPHYVEYEKNNKKTFY